MNTYTNTHTGTIHWFSRLKGIGQIRPDSGGHDVLADIADFVHLQPPGSLEAQLVSYRLDEADCGGRATHIHIVRRI
ncbi:cold shock domain-containing protein [Massilia arenosa]|uniref:Cold shock domain-containing protein n=1 Tax=Zemynaea arenosa TaxID=2561931 RepID=A0A4Y9SJ44_9BURK|nr:cold shock domain-containing protein [Massilia arenosa]TFW25555.1 cold shock domain-containing protein [Massilia arenosa]